MESAAEEQVASVPSVPSKVDAASSSSPVSTEAEYPTAAETHVVESLASPSIPVETPASSSEAAEVVACREEYPATDASASMSESAMARRGDGSVAAIVVPPGSGMSEDIRQRLSFLCSKDQKTTVQRECMKAVECEAKLMARLERTIAAYSEALEIDRVCRQLPPAFPDGMSSPMSQEVVANYQERISLLQGIVAMLKEENVISLNGLTKVEKTKGLVFKSYAMTASVVKGIGDEAGVTEPVVAAVSNVRGAFASLSSRSRGMVPTEDDARNTALSQETHLLASAFEEPVLKNTDTFQEPLPVDQYNEGGIGPY